MQCPPQKKESNQTRLTVGRNIINYTGKLGIPTAKILLIKIMINSAISNPDAKFTTFDISNFYLNTPMKIYEYLKPKLSNISAEVIKIYNIKEKANAGVSVYVEIRKGMYGLP